MSKRNTKPLRKDHCSKSLGKRAVAVGAIKRPGKGSHTIFELNGIQCTIPQNKDLPMGTQRSIIKVLAAMGVRCWPLIFPLLGAAFILGQR